MGSPLWDAAGRPLGVLAAMSEKPLEQSARAEAVFRIFANRAGSELERMRAESALLTSEAKFRGLLESAPDAILFVNPAGRITFCNFNGEKMFGANRTELLGRPIEDLIPERFHARHIAHRQHYTGAPKGRQMGSRLELLARRRDGSEFPVDIMLTPVELNGELTVMAMARDISERKQRELELEALAQVSAALRGAATRAEMLPIILDQLLALLKAEGATIAMRDPATGEIVLELGRGQWGGVTGTRIPAGQGISGDVIATGQAYVSGDALQDPRTYAGDRMGDLRAVACVPLIAQSRAIGALWVGRSATPHQEFSSAEVRLLTAIADMTATAIQRVTLYEQTATRLQRLDALRAIDLAITASLDLNLTLNVLLAQLTSQMGVHAADVLLLNPHTHLLEYAAGHGFHVAALKRRALRVGEGLAGRVALDRQALVAPDLAARLAELPAPTARHFQTEGFVTYGGLPLIAKGEVKGVLEIFHRSPLALDAEWLEFLNALAAQAAIAIDNAGLFSNLQRSNADLALAYDATIEGWSRALDLRDKETEGHTQRVTELTLKLARALRLSESELVHIRRGALLHDIGKMGVPDGILLKAGPLTDEEWVIMRQHPQFAYEMLAPIAYLRPALDIPYCHHEKWDGLGYPRGLREETIPLAARLFAVIDVWDALRSDRPYRQGWPEEKVREHIRSLAGKHFDPQAVEAFLRLEAGEC
jgi:PAS domain S-box-containing protein/putative nucleotidyltransferase with HDIG domain